MTIQRQYSLPNVKLVIEGLSNDNGATVTTPRPPISILVNTECHFAGREQPLTGGREFLDNLVHAVSEYAQEFLSQVPHPQGRSEKAGSVHLDRVEQDLHRLTVSNAVDSSHVGNSPAITQIDLKTVQLFDLVEAIDQFLADAQTIPDLQLNLAPVGRRFAASQESITKRTAPLVLGVSSLAVAAIAFFFLPVPQVRRPEPEPTPTTQESPLTSPTPDAGASPDPTESPTAEPLATVSPDSETSPSPDTTSESTSDASPSSTTTESGAGGSADAIFANAPEITDPDQIETLNQELRDKISSAWNREHTFDENLIYRVGVAANGDILGFKQTNQASIDFTRETPLLDLLYIPVGDETPTNEPIGQFKVVFTPDGVVQVNPWNGWPAENSTTDDSQ